MESAISGCACGHCYSKASIGFCHTPRELVKLRPALAVFDLFLRGSKSRRHLDKQIAIGLSRAALPAITRCYKACIRCDAGGILFVRVRDARLDEHMKMIVFVPFWTKPTISESFLEAYVTAVDELSRGFDLDERSKHLVTCECIPDPHKRYVICYSRLAQWLRAAEYLVTHPGCRSPPTAIAVGGMIGLPNGHRMGIIWSIVTGTFVPSVSAATPHDEVEEAEGESEVVYQPMDVRPDLYASVAALQAPDDSISTVLDRVDRRRMALFERANNLTTLSNNEKGKLMVHVLTMPVERFAVCESMIELLERNVSAPKPGSVSSD